MSLNGMNQNWEIPTPNRPVDLPDAVTLALEKCHIETDEWGSPIRSPKHQKLGKRKALWTSPSQTSLRPKYSEDQAENLLYNAFSQSDETFLELLFESMPLKQLRTQVAQVSTDWCRLAYKVLRRKFGNKVFSILYTVNTPTKNLVLSQLFHPSILCIKISDFLDRLEVKDFRLDEKPTEGYLSKVPRPAEIQGIICFGNDTVQEDLLSCDNDHELPNVDVFVYVLSPAIFFTSPDLDDVGSSFNGLSKKTSDQCSQNGGKHLSSLLFPRSSHFALDVFTLEHGYKTWSLEQKFRRNMFQPSLKTKAVIMFQLYEEEPEVINWMVHTLNKAFEDGSNKVSLISGHFTFVGTNITKPNATPFAVQLGIRCDDSSSVLSVEMDFGPNKPDNTVLKFNQMDRFLNGGSFEQPHTYFALMFCYVDERVGFEVSEDFTPVSSVMKAFQKRFPFVPLQAISSLSRIRHEQATPLDVHKISLNLQMNNLMTDPSKEPDKKAIFLLVKYPLESDFGTLTDSGTSSPTPREAQA